MSRRDKSKLLADVGVDKVYELCKELRPTHGVTKKGNRVRACCMFPGHSDTHPSMDIVFTDERVFAKCLSCGQYESDGFTIVSHITGIRSVAKIYADVFGLRFGLKIAPELDAALAQEDLFSHLKESLKAAAEHVLSSASISQSAEFQYARDAVNHLVSRGFSASTFSMLGVGAFPTLEHFSQFADADAQLTVPDYLGTRVFDAKPRAVGRYGGWLMFPYYTTPTCIGRIKLRNPQDKTQEIWLGPHREEARGFFGLQHVTNLIGRDIAEAKTAYIVEGEFDQLAMVVEQAKVNPNAQHIVLCASGAGASDVDLLAESRIEQVTLIGDNDKAGQTFVRRVLEAATQEEITDFSVYDWTTMSQHKDPDDVVQAGDYVPFISGLLSKTDVKELHQWARDQAIAEIAALPAPSIVAKIGILNDRISYIKDAVSRDLYVAEVSSATGIDGSVLAKSLVPTDTPRGFTLHIERLLAEQAITVASVDETTVLLYSKRAARTFTVSLSKGRDAMVAMATQLLGMNVYDYVAAKIGVPEFISLTQGKTPMVRAYKAQVSDVQYHADIAILNFCAVAPPLHKFRSYHQGIHWYDMDNDPIRSAAHPVDASRQGVFVVNGTDIYVGQPGEDGLLKYEKLDQPTFGLSLFYGDDAQLWSGLLRKCDINERPPMSRAECFEMLLDIMDSWIFEEHALTRVLMAAYIMAIQHIDVFAAIPYLFFTAPSQSGKSTMSRGVLRGTEPAEIGLIEAAVGADDYTAAGMLQQSEGRTLLVCLDEAEKKGDAKTRASTALDDMLHALRNMGGREGSTRARGGRHNNPSQTVLRFPAVLSAIMPLQDEADRNRWFSVGFVHSPGREKPEVAIMAKYGEEGIARLRKSLLLHSLQSAYEDHFTERDIRRNVLGKVIKSNSTRGESNLAPLMVQVRAAGHDDIAWAEAYLTTRSETLASSSTSESDLVFRAVFETNAITMPGDYNRRSLTNVARDPDLRPHLCRADVGAYILPGANYVVLYPKKLSEILKFSASQRNSMHAGQIFSMLDRHPRVERYSTHLGDRPQALAFLRKYITNPRPEELLIVMLDDTDLVEADVYEADVL